jgi:hypothetical protein
LSQGQDWEQGEGIPPEEGTGDEGKDQVVNPGEEKKREEAENLPGGGKTRIPSTGSVVAEAAREAAKTQSLRSGG